LTSNINNASPARTKHQTFSVVDLNRIFLFVALISPLLVLARAWRPGGMYLGWRVAAIVVLAITGVSWFLFRNQAGYIGGGAWFVLLFIPAIGLRKLTELFAQQRYRAARRLAFFLQILHPSKDLRHQVALLQTLASQSNAAATQNWPREDRHRHLRHAPAVLVLIALNVFVFLIEIARGNTPDALHRLGALDPNSVLFRGEYWRLLTSLFLHYGVVHLLFNLFALYILGPGLERAIGTFRFSLCYLIAGLGSTAGVIALTVVRIVQPGELVGASGAVMGIVGAWAGFLLRHQHVPRARQRLLNILVIVAIQVAFDLSTPQVSMAAHLCGLITGFIVGIAIAPKKMSI
jgi:membrane associated rhomboid family serine protease